MHFTLSELAAATGGALHLATGASDASTVTGASIDSRSIERGQFFVPIVAERDGHGWIDGAIERGAAATLADRDLDAEALGISVIRVADTADALEAAGRAAAERLAARQCPVIGITGSVGKTSVKDLAVAALGSLGAHASERSFNNELGVPLTLLNAPDDTGAAIVEMGARGMGHIDFLCSIARPTIGVVTMIGEVHTSEFGTIEAVAEGKGELLAALPEHGVAIVNADTPFADRLAARTTARVLTYGAGADVRAEQVELDDQLRPRFVVHAPSGRAEVSLAVRGAHQVSNALAALAIAEASEVDLDIAAQGIAKAALSPWRMEFHHLDSGAVVINDAYNANLLSVTAALESLAAVSATRRVAVLGTMAELGDLHDEHHLRAAERARELGIEVIAYDETAYGLAIEGDFDAVIDRLGPLGAGDAVCVKGSRVAGLEDLAARLIVSD